VVTFGYKHSVLYQRIRSTKQYTVVYKRYFKVKSRIFRHIINSLFKGFNARVKKALPFWEN